MASSTYPLSTPRRRNWKTELYTNLSRVILILVCAFTLLPLLWVFLSAFSNSPSLYSATLIPKTLTLDHFKDLFVDTEFALWLKNSAIVCLGGSTLAMFLTVSMAYAFSRFKFWGRKNGLIVLILIQMLPTTVTIVAIYRMLDLLNLIDNLFGLILIYAGTTIPFNAWLMRGYFDSIPHEMEEAAYVDGANRFQAFIQIALPMCLPMAVVVFIFNLIAFYNDYILASIILSGTDHYTIALGLRFFDQQYAANWSMFAAASLLGCLPIMIIFYSLQKYLVQGLTKGAIKG
ncbi:MAG TPA: sugar ABC transporter permease [Anaerolineaceae bacterium]|nr:sugar ABC transporter permease [Anaerolineaceae bacterium]